MREIVCFSDASATQLYSIQCTLWAATPWCLLNTDISDVKYVLFWKTSGIEVQLLIYF